MKHDTTRVRGDLATCSGTRQVRTVCGYIQVSARCQVHVSTVPAERHALQMNPQEDLSATRTPELRRAETHRHKRILRDASADSVTSHQANPRTRCITDRTRPIPPSDLAVHSAAMLPSPQLTKRPPRGGEECLLEPTVIRHDQLRCRIWMWSRPARHPPRGVDEDKVSSLSQLPLSQKQRDNAIGTDERASWVLAGEPTNGFPASGNKPGSGSARPAAATTQALQLPARDEDPAFAETPPRDELTRPVTDTPRCADRTETSLSSREGSQT